MADTLKRLAGPVVGTAAEATLYTVPGSTTAIIRSIRVTNTTAGALTFKMSIGADAAGTRKFSDYSVAANDFIVDPSLQVLAAAETLRWNGPAGLTVEVNGVEVT